VVNKLNLLIIDFKYAGDLTAVRIGHSQGVAMRTASSLSMAHWYLFAQKSSKLRELLFVEREA